jgi:dTDP-3-amino-3,4,6-trideoxy-alpha-D-glucose transaminase
MILLNDFKRQWADTRLAAISAFSAIGESGYYVLGPEVREFEEALARYWGMACAVGVASGLDAIEIGLKARGCKPGDRVLTTPLSAFATTLGILKAGAVPVFVDTDRFGLIDLEHCRNALAARHNRHGGIPFFVPVHLYGHALDMGALAALRDEFDCCVIEDCAQSIGASHNGIGTGTVGQMAAVSFYPTKNLGALGDGGAILTGDERSASIARMLRDYGQSEKYHHDLVGYNSRLDELQAGLLRRVSLGKLPCWTEFRRRIAAAYVAGIDNPGIQVPGAPAGSNSCWHLFPVLVSPDRKRDFMSWLKGRGVLSAEHYPIPIPEQRALAGGNFEVIGGIDSARQICRSEVSLPIHPYLNDEEISQVIDACNAWKG